VRVLAFKKPTGDIVAELMNSKNEDVETSVRYRNQMLRVKLPAVSITTAIWSDSAKSKP
jgi:O-glycosyl hydrolase